MNQTGWARLDTIARNLSPFAFSLALVVIAMIPIKVPGLSAIVPSLGLIAIFFWVVHRPDLMPAWAVFLIGVFQDLLSGGHLGIGALVLLLVWLAVVAQRRVYSTGTFLQLWAIFVLVAAGALGLTWLLNNLISGRAMDIQPLAFQYLTTVAIYPCVAWAFAQVQRGLVR